MAHTFIISPETLINEYELIYPYILSYKYCQVVLSIEIKNIPYRVVRILEEWQLCGPGPKFAKLLNSFNQDVPQWENDLLQSLMQNKSNTPDYFIENGIN